MSEPPAVNLFNQVVDSVSVLASPAESQEEWARTGSWPKQEMRLQLADAVPGWFPRLREDCLIDSFDEEALRRLNDHLTSMASQPELFRTWSAVRDAPEWQEARALAAAALASLRRPLEEKATR